ncbi:hypothetical protein H072_8329 [Dactylellina haptotyla CBS 200.50]|uniref:Uncharacterized protein n=1 Tax=Dactylellina haptotyla (strain CBS 200.50) TaxID=1284197 RepID=S8AA55_DACHA|nr:hypothetical protein H072_8329 [Dactylellina haptotyla CBS 200.50]
MFASSRFSLLLAAFVAFVLFVDARTIITTQTCASRYCDTPPKNVYKVTKTIHKTVPYTVVRWKTIFKPRSTRTVKVTRTVTSQRYSTILQTTSTTSLITVYIGTTTYTRTLIYTTTSTTTTITLLESTVTITTPSVTVPAPSGFVAIKDDPINDGLEVEIAPPPWWQGDRHRRSAEPEPKPEQKYVSAVTCTKTLITKTGTSDLWRTTTKAAATTTKTIVSTKTVLPPILTTTTTITKITRITTTTARVVFASTTFSKTLTSYTQATTWLSTVTTNLPAPTFYESCDVNNRSPPPEYRRHWTVVDAGPDPGETIKTTFFNGTSYDCCAACHTYDEGGVCIGSIWRALTGWGELGCQIVPEFPGPCPEFWAQCDLIIAVPDAPAQCHTRGYKLSETSKDRESIVSNGLSCPRWQFQLWITSW